MATTVEWIVAADVALELGIPTADATEDAWLEQCTAAANAYAYRRRLAAGYTDDPALAPGPDAHVGTVLYAAALYKQRGTVDGYASFTELGNYAPAAGGTMGEVNKLLGVPRMAVG